MKFIKSVFSGFSSVAAIFSYILIFKNIYQIIGLFWTRKFKAAKKNHTYSILIAARNEETVIGNLLDSINRQDYDMSLVKVFVVADNCTDRTAEIARQKGAYVYERFDSEHRTKGYALQYLVKCIDRDFGVESSEAYFIFDADNLLKSDYIKRMNESFDAGEKIVTSYRHSKNIGDNWLSASYAVHWLRTMRNEHRARSVLHLATRIQGTGFLFSNELIKNGWNYVTLTEDRAFCADAVVNGYKISYNDAAIFFDEQPVDIRIAMRQRIRWAKGHIEAFFESGPKLFFHIFYTGGMANRDKSASFGKKLFNNLRFRFMSFDMFTVFIGGSAALPIAIFVPLGRKLFGPLDRKTLYGFLLLTVFGALDWYIKRIIIAAYIYIIEHRRMNMLTSAKKIWFCITFPIFDLFGMIALVIALFTHVEWKPIPHKADIKINDIDNSDNAIK